MKYSLKATSIIEAIIVLLVVVTGITGVYWLLISSQKLADSTSQRIEAIQIARDWLEAFTNIRDTNWILYAADYENCWNTLNYDSSCIWTTGNATDINHGTNEGLIIYRDTENKFRLWLESYSAWESYKDPTYRDSFEIQKENWFYTQSWGTLYWVWTDPFYTREIQLDYKNNDGTSAWPGASDRNMLEVNVIVQWNDRARQEPQRLKMSTLLTNWKAKQ